MNVIVLFDLLTAPLPLRWMAPPAIIERMLLPESDVWAFGVVFWEILTLGATPFYDGLDCANV